MAALEFQRNRHQRRDQGPFLRCMRQGIRPDLPPKCYFPVAMDLQGAPWLSSCLLATIGASFL